MHEMDLIPADYRRTQTMRKLLIGFAAFYALIFSSLLVGKIILEMKVSTLESQVGAYEKQNKILIEQQKLNTDLRNRKSLIEGQYAFVKMLQQGGGGDQIFQVFDRVLDLDIKTSGTRNIWMNSWTYTAANLDSGNEKSLEQHMKIMVNGLARDHEALSIFVENLIRQSEISDVNVINTTMVGEDVTTVTFVLEMM
ncbi:MAG: hypothetical protein AB8D52_06890 [Gammaproteobacteria bacterium]